jgi:LPXTG-motif cell wall-anchored protein
VAKFAAAGLGTAAGLAAVVNSIAESQLNPHAVNGDVAGLFQLAPWGGAPNCGAAGYGMSQSARKNARRSINRIIDVVQGKQLIALGGTCQDVGVHFRQRAAAGASIAELTGIFCNEIERPGAAHCTSRPGNARTLFGARADAPGGSLPQLGRIGGALIATPWYYWLGVALLAGGAVVWWRRRKRRRAGISESKVG